jgi:hypothetical protein
VTFETVNWVTGMLLTPEHFRQSDRFVEESLGWLVRYCLPGSGLVGGGARLPESERGLARHDPKLAIEDDGVSVRISVLQARGITPSGCVVDIGEGRVVRAAYSRGELAGATELLLYVEDTGLREDDPESTGRDDVNPNLPAQQWPSYRVRLGATADAAERSLVVGRVRRASESLNFEVDSQFIPVCAMVLAHSSLYASWSRLQSEFGLLAGEFAELHRAVARYAEQISRRGVDSRGDLDILAFLERAVLALDHAVYETADAGMPPARLFLEVERMGRRLALALDLSPATQHFLQTLVGADASYADLLDAERANLAGRRGLNLREDLSLSILRAGDTVGRVRRLVEALAGKYLDYRINRTLDAVRFLLDRQGEHFYVAIATPGHPQRDGELLTLVFSQLNLAGRHQYRLVVLGDPQGTSGWQLGDELRVDVRINAAGGSSRPMSRTVACEVPSQRNFAVDFDTPADVATITGLHVQVHPAHRVRGAILFQLRRGLAVEGGAAPQAGLPPESVPHGSGSASPESSGPRPPIIKVKKPT